MYFAAASDSSTVELWRSNGTLVGTTMVKDFNGFVSASPQVFTTYNGLVYFTAKEPSSVRTLWKTDGTEAGTVRVKNVDVGNTMIYFFSPGGVEKMLFTATDSVHGSEMWISDGTELGTNILIDVEPGKVSSWPSNFYQINDKLLFFGGSNSNTSGLWITDGTENGTKRIENFSGYMGIPYPRFARLHDKVFFIASDTAKKPEIWVTDGTEDSTYKIAVPDTTIPKPIDNTYFKFVSYNNELYFEGEYDNTGRELWKITYTPSTTKLTNTEVSSYIVYPNPTTGKVVIIDEAQLIKRVVVKNIVGEVLKQESGNVKSVDLTDFPSGLYLFNIDTDNSTEVVKVVKQ